MRGAAQLAGGLSGTCASRVGYIPTGDTGTLAIERCTRSLQTRATDYCYINNTINLR